MIARRADFLAAYQDADYAEPLSPTASMQCVQPKQTVLPGSEALDRLRWRARCSS